MTKKELVGKIRQKFPGAYDSVGDDQLADAWLKKYPVYQSQITEEAPIEEKQGLLDAPMKANTDIKSVADIPTEIAKTGVNFATFPLRVAKDTLYDIPKETISLFKEQGGDALGWLAEGLADTEIKLTKGAIDALSGLGKFIQGGISKAGKKVTGKSLDPEAEKAFNMEAVTNVSKALQKFIVEHPEDVMLLLHGMSRAGRSSPASKDVSENVRIQTKNRVSQYDNFIKNGDATAEAVYANPAQKIFKPDVATQVIKDSTDNLTRLGRKDLATQLTQMVDANNLTPTSMMEAVDKLLKSSGGTGDVVTSMARSTKIPQALEEGGAAIKETIKDTVDTSISKVKGAGKKVKDVAKEKVMDVAEKTLAEPIPKPVENVLKETKSSQFDEYARAAQKATENYKNQTPLELAGTRAQTALDTIQRKLNTIGEQKRGVLNRASVGNKPVGSIVVKFRQNLSNYLKGKTSVEGDSKLFKDIEAEAKRLGSNPSAADVDKFIDFVQERIYTGQRDLTVPVTDASTAALRRMTGELNESLKSQLPPAYKNLNQKYAQMVDVRNELNLKLGKDGEKGGALMKRVFSPSDARTKELFAQVKAETGIDLVNEATLARFLMEIMGDARQASLLEQLQLPKLSQKGLLNFVADKAFKKLVESVDGPEAKLQRARELTQP